MSDRERGLSRGLEDSGSKKSAALEQLEQMMEAVRARRLSQAGLDGLRDQLAGYLAQEISRFREHRRQFSDAQTQEAFADVVAALERFQDLLSDLSWDSWKLPDSEWEAYFEDARDADRLLAEAAEFLEN